MRRRRPRPPRWPSPCGPRSMSIASDASARAELRRVAERRTEQEVRLGAFVQPETPAALRPRDRTRLEVDVRETVADEHELAGGRPGDRRCTARRHDPALVAVRIEQREAT